MDTDEINRLLTQPTISIPDAGRLLGLGLNKSYEAAKAGQIPTIAFGKRRRAITAPIRKMLGLEAA